MDVVQWRKAENQEEFVMWQGEGAVETLEPSDCWKLLQQESLGRLAVSVGGEIDIFPINFHADGESILIRTAPGTKLLEMTISQTVAFEIDGYTDTEAWSVVAKGPARRLERQAEIAEADDAPLTPWIPTLKYVYVRITPRTVSGRRFPRGEEPDRYAV